MSRCKVRFGGAPKPAPEGGCALRKTSQLECLKHSTLIVVRPPGAEVALNLAGNTIRIPQNSGEPNLGRAKHVPAMSFLGYDGPRSFAQLHLGIYFLSLFCLLLKTGRELLDLLLLLRDGSFELLHAIMFFQKLI